jgi:hypothetical protein
MQRGRGPGPGGGAHGPTFLPGTGSGGHLHLYGPRASPLRGGLGQRNGIHGAGPRCRYWRRGSDLPGRSRIRPHDLVVRHARSQWDLVGTGRWELGAGGPPIGRFRHVHLHRARHGTLPGGPSSDERGGGPAAGCRCGRGPHTMHQRRRTSFVRRPRWHARSHRSVERPFRTGRRHVHAGRAASRYLHLRGTRPGCLCRLDGQRRGAGAGGGLACTERVAGQHRWMPSLHLVPATPGSSECGNGQLELWGWCRAGRVAASGACLHQRGNLPGDGHGNGYGGLFGHGRAAFTGACVRRAGGAFPRCPPTPWGRTMPWCRSTTIRYPR